jgi:hypothetical protein
MVCQDKKGHKIWGNMIANEVSIVIKVKKDTLANMRIEIREKIRDAFTVK